MLPLGLAQIPEQQTCLTVIKAILPEIRSPEIVGPYRWSLVEELPEVVGLVQDGDLAVWGTYGLWEFRPKHIGLIVNYDESLVYHLTDVTLVEPHDYMQRGSSDWPLRYYRPRLRVSLA